MTPLYDLDPAQASFSRYKSSGVGESFCNDTCSHLQMKPVQEWWQRNAVRPLHGDGFSGTTTSSAIVFQSLDLICQTYYVHCSQLP